MTAGIGAGARIAGNADEVPDLLDAALEAYQEVDPAAAARLTDARRRWDEPLRVAIVGRVKAGKSTLLNALLGARIAPTDAGECTRLVTVYRHGSVPRVVLREAAGGQRSLPVRRVDGGLRLDLGDADPVTADHLLVDWPAPGLAATTFVDTPGLSSLSMDTSARTSAFLAPENALSGADAVVFLTRQMQTDDLAFLSAFQARAGGPAGRATTITVLSRADEVGVGRLDALNAAGQVARRMAADPAIGAVASAVLPVAGLLALGGRTLRHIHFVALRSLARGPRQDVDAMLLTADRFCRREAPVAVEQSVRFDLLDRLGLFGVRFSVTLLRAGMDDAGELAEELVRRSGLAELQRMIEIQFTRRAGQLRAATVLGTVESVLRERPLADDERLWRALERLQLCLAPSLAEVTVLARAHESDGGLPEEVRAEGERLLGAEGGTAAARLGLPGTAPADQVRSAAEAALAQWAGRAAAPLAHRAAREAAAVVVLSCESLLAALPPPAGSPAVGTRPASAGPEQEQDERGHD